MVRGGGAVTRKVLSLRELQMAKRMLNQPKVPPCQRELTALLNAMDRKEKGEEVSIRILQTALEHCLQTSVSGCVPDSFVCGDLICSRVGDDGTGVGCSEGRPVGQCGVHAMRISASAYSIVDRSC